MSPTLTWLSLMASLNETWLVDFGDPYSGEPANQRPAIVIGPSALFGDTLPFVVVAPMTTTARGISFHVEIDPNAGNGLTELSYVQCEMIRSISKKRLLTRLGFVGLVDGHRIETVIRRILDY
jgi:mRNA interferase MazF